MCGLVVRGLLRGVVVVACFHVIVIVICFLGCTLFVDLLVLRDLSLWVGFDLICLAFRHGC